MKCNHPRAPPPVRTRWSFLEDERARRKKEQNIPYKLCTATVRYCMHSTEHLLAEQITSQSQAISQQYPKPKCTVQEQPSGGVFGLGGGGGAHAPPASLPPTHLQSNGTACTLVYGRHRSPHRPPSVTHHPCIMTSLDHLTTRARLDLSSHSVGGVCYRQGGASLA